MNNLHPLFNGILNQAASPVSVVDNRLHKLVETMAQSHFLTLIDEDEISDFISELEVLGFGSIAKKMRSEMSASKAEVYGRIKERLNDNGLD